MKKIILFLALLDLAIGGPLNPPIETTLRGTTGVEVKFTIIAIWKDGFHARKANFQKPLFITWDKVDLVWLAKEHSEIDQLRDSAKPAPPPLDMKEANAQLESLKKNGFRASRTIVYDSPQTGKRIEVTNDAAQKYYRLVRSIRAETITDNLKLIENQLKSDTEIWESNTNDPVSRRYKSWATRSFRPFLNQLQKFQEYVDAPFAGASRVSPSPAQDPFESKSSDGWF